MPKKSVKELSAIVVNAEPTMNLEPSTLYVFLPEEHNLACSWNTKGQKFQKVENDENRFFAITSSKLFKIDFVKGI